MEGEGIIIVEELFSSELDFLSENLKSLQQPELIDLLWQHFFALVKPTIQIDLNFP
ncbi:MAG: hypothetical protein V4622_14630 [Bacteroidota bacterium]